MLHKTPNTWNYRTLDSLTPINNLQFVITKSNFFRNISSLKKKKYYLQSVAYFSPVRSQ